MSDSEPFIERRTGERRHAGRRFVVQIVAAVTGIELRSFRRVPSTIELTDDDLRPIAERGLLKTRRDIQGI